MHREEAGKDLPANNVIRGAEVKEVAEETAYPSAKRGATSGSPSHTDSIPGGNSLPKTYPSRPPFSPEARSLAEQLEESNVNSIQRLIEIFGVEFINRKVEEASKLYSEALLRGDMAYEQPNTPVATGKSKARSRGGVFFFLLRQHCSSLGLDWNGLRIAPPTWYERKSARKQTVSAEIITEPERSAAVVNSLVSLAETSSAQSIVKSSAPGDAPDPKVSASGATRAPSAPGTPADAVISRPIGVNSLANAGEHGDKTLESKGESRSRPTRLKATLTGSLLGHPKMNPNGKEDLVELRFEAEMNGSSLPKGLPDLGGSKVVVWCTKKQLDKVLQQIAFTPQTRFIIEGEPIPAVNADLTPFLRIICTRLTTLELEQKRNPVPGQ